MRGQLGYRYHKRKNTHLAGNTGESYGAPVRHATLKGVPAEARFEDDGVGDGRQNGREAVLRGVVQAGEEDGRVAGHAEGRDDNVLGLDTDAGEGGPGPQQLPVLGHGQLGSLDAGVQVRPGLVVHGLGQGDDQDGQGAEVHGPGDPEDPAPAEELGNGPTEQSGDVGARGQHDGKKAEGAAALVVEEQICHGGRA